MALLSIQPTKPGWSLEIGISKCEAVATEGDDVYFIARYLEYKPIVMKRSISVTMHALVAYHGILYILRRHSSCLLLLGFRHHADAAATLFPLPSTNTTVNSNAPITSAITNATATAVITSAQKTGAHLGLARVEVRRGRDDELIAVGSHTKAW